MRNVAKVIQKNQKTANEKKAPSQNLNGKEEDHAAVKMRNGKRKEAKKEQFDLEEKVNHDAIGENLKKRKIKNKENMSYQCSKW